ncbi:MAG: hypothetical protein ACIARR_01015 [Phycisphaerales bacterium JB059]
MNPFIQTGFNTPFPFNTTPFGSFNSFPGVSGFNQGFGAWNNFPFNATNTWNSGWNPAFGTGFAGGFDPSFNAGANFGFNTFGFNGGFNGANIPAANWNTPFNGIWNTPFNSFWNAPFASTPFWNAFPGAFWNGASTGSNPSGSENARINNATPINGFPFGVPFFNPGAFGPTGATPNGEHTPARNAA